MSRALTERQRQVLDVLGKARSSMTCNDIGSALGFKQGDAKPAYDGGTRVREMGPAVFVTNTVTSLRKRGLVTFGPVPGGRSGTAYQITDAGQEVRSAVIEGDA